MGIGFLYLFQTLTVSAQEVFEESPNPILEETETEVEENTGSRSRYQRSNRMLQTYMRMV